MNDTKKPKMIPLERQHTSPSDAFVPGVNAAVGSSALNLQPVTRQPTSPFDNFGPQPVTRQATSPFDLGAEVEGNEKFKTLSDRRVEFTLPNIKLIYSAGDATSLFVANGGNDAIRVGERIEVNDWASNTGMLLSYNGKRVHASGTLASQPVDPKAQKSVQKFAKALSEVTGFSLSQLLETLAKNADGSPLSIARAQKIATAMTQPESAIRW